MIINTDELIKICKIVGDNASQNGGIYTGLLQIKNYNSKLHFIVGDKEYRLDFTSSIDCNEDFNATIKSELFTKLILSTTVESMSIETTDQNLIIKGNGTYKLPLIFNENTITEIPSFVFDTVTESFSLKKEFLNLVSKFNRSEILKGGIIRPVQKLYYMDKEGVITFTSGACITNYNLDINSKFLMGDNLIKLWSLFITPEVNAELGYTTLASNITSYKIHLYNDQVDLFFTLPSEQSLIGSVPVKAIRDRGSKVYSNRVIIDKDSLLGAISRMNLFIENTKSYIYFHFTENGVYIQDVAKNNNEFINYESGSYIESYECFIDSIDLKNILVNYNNSNVIIDLGDNTAWVIRQPQIINIIPECELI